MALVRQPASAESDGESSFSGRSHRETTTGRRVATDYINYGDLHKQRGNFHYKPQRGSPLMWVFGPSSDESFIRWSKPWSCLTSLHHHECVLQQKALFRAHRSNDFPPEEHYSRSDMLKTQINTHFCVCFIRDGSQVEDGRLAMIII